MVKQKEKREGERRREAVRQRAMPAWEEKTDCQTHTHIHTHTELNIATNRIIVLAVFTLRDAFFSLTRLSLSLPLFCHLPFSSVCRPPTENIHTHKHTNSQSALLPLREGQGVNTQNTMPLCIYECVFSSW